MVPGHFCFAWKQCLHLLYMNMWKVRLSETAPTKKQSDSLDNSTGHVHRGALLRPGPSLLAWFESPRFRLAESSEIRKNIFKKDVPYDQLKPFSRRMFPYDQLLDNTFIQKSRAACRELMRMVPTTIRFLSDLNPES